MAGFPAPPLAMLDEVSLTLTQSIRKAAADAAEREGRPVPDAPGADVIDRMVEEFGRKGKAAGAGFYDYPRTAGRSASGPVSASTSPPAAARTSR